MNYCVHIFNDKEMPISELQLELLKEILPRFEIYDWPKSMGWGTEQIQNIWKAYELVHRKADDSDFIARVDSDVFFFNDRIFRMVANSNADLVGDGHYVNLEYSQGGCYFLTKNGVSKISENIETASMSDALQGCPILVEDVAATFFARNAGLNVWLTWFMAFPQEIKNSNGIGRWIKFKFSCAHFVMRNKDKMIEAYYNYILIEEEKKQFRDALIRVEDTRKIKTKDI